jgi:hypothetical protein
MTVGNMKGETIVINTAFLQGDFEERIFMEVPTGIMPNFLENTVRNGTQVFVGEKLIIWQSNERNQQEDGFTRF